MTRSEPESAPRKPGRPLSSKAAARDQIKQAALIEFARLGFKGASIDHIAASASVAKPLVHYHFGSKVNLWKTVVGEAFEAFRTEVIIFSTNVAQQDPEAALESFAEKLVRLGAERPYLVHIAIDETRQGGDRSDWLGDTFLVPMHQIMTQVLALISPETPDVRATASHLVPALFGAANFAFIDRDVLRKAYRVDVFSEAYIQEQTRFITMLMQSCLSDQSLRKPDKRSAE